MHKLKCLVFAILLGAAAGADAAGAQGMDAAQRALVERYVAAVAAQDRVGLRKLYHPASLACINAGNRDYFDFIFTKELSYGAALRGSYAIKRFAPLGADAATAATMGGLIPNPVPPTHLFQIDARWNDNRPAPTIHSVTIVRAVAESGGAWFIVLGCPSDKAVALFREKRAADERQQARVKQLADALGDPLLAEIRSLLAQNRRLDAINRYRSAANVDLTTAVQVIDILADR